MAQSPTRLYEGLFLVSQGAAGSDFAGVVNHIKEVLARAEAEVLMLTKWDERRLAYDIKVAKRGTYFLALFNVRATQIANIERDCNLSETIVRALILRGDHIGEAELEEYMKSTPVDQDAALRGPDEEKTTQSEEAPATETAEKTEKTEKADEVTASETPAVETPAAEEAPATKEEVVTEETAEKAE